MVLAAPRGYIGLMADDDAPHPVPAEGGRRTGTDPGPAGDDDLPVVARMVVEIRSDGSRTIARGALEDRLVGETVQVRAEAATPLALAGALAKALLRTPVLRRVRDRGREIAATARGLLPRGRDD